MPRRKTVNLKRDIGVDARFKSSLIQKLTNVVMKQGKKNIARKIVYDAMDTLVKKAGGDAKKGYELFEKAKSKSLRCFTKFMQNR